MNSSFRAIGYLSACFTGGYILFQSLGLPAQNALPPPPATESSVVLTAFDSLFFRTLPVLTLPGSYLKTSLPPQVDNSELPYFPGFHDQMPYMTCNQVAGVAYMYTYEINRIRNQSASVPENRYPPAYTWNFYNSALNEGVSFIHSFNLIRRQGHLTETDYGTKDESGTLKWATGYDRYYRGMKNRLKGIQVIEIDNPEGILTMKHYLHDHLDGSLHGGMAVFNGNNSAGFQYGVLPEGTPEAGRYVWFKWGNMAGHGFTITGYNDSIRYDLNSNGMFTNDTDINGDSVVDMNDWEVGGFEIANSLTGMNNDGFFYALYSSFAKPFGKGGIWNSAAFVIDAEAGYTPLMTMKVHLSYNNREKIRILAGISSDTTREFPEHVIEFPMFSFQGGQHVMQGVDAIAGNETIEAGLDVPPLLNFIVPGNPARFYCIVEENDPKHTGEGTIHHASFLCYGNSVVEFAAPQTEVDIRNDKISLVSVTGTMEFGEVSILTSHLPSWTPGGNYQASLHASGGIPSYEWDLMESYHIRHASEPYIHFTDQKLELQNNLKQYATQALPFPFPFYGTQHDTVYVHSSGMILFEPLFLPFPWQIGPMDMFSLTQAVVPAFSQDYEYIPAAGDGIWVQHAVDSVTIRWQCSLEKDGSYSVHHFAVRLFPNGRFCLSFDPDQESGSGEILCSGISNGDGTNRQLRCYDGFEELISDAAEFTPPVLPAGCNVSKDGLLSVTAADTGVICGIPVRATDCRGISAERILQFSSGLEIACEVNSPSGVWRFNEPAGLMISIVNTGATALDSLTVILACEDPSVLISDSLLGIPFILAGNSYGSVAFSFLLRSILPDKTEVPFLLKIRSSGRDWRYLFYLTVSAPSLRILPPFIDDGVNGRLEPGETADLHVTLINEGTLAAEDVVIELHNYTALPELLSAGTLDAGKIEAGNKRELCFRLKAPRSAGLGDTATVIITVTDKDSRSDTCVVPILLGQIPVAVLSLAPVSTTPSVMSSLLDSLNIPYSFFETIPDDLEEFPIHLMILGNIGTVYTLSEEEGMKFARYLFQGGRLYIEGGTFWSAHTSLHDLLYYTRTQVPIYSFHAVVGVPWTLTSGMSFGYPTSIGFSRSDIQPVSPAYSILTTGTDLLKPLVYAYDGYDYNVIGSQVEFGKLTDSLPSQGKGVLLKKYLDLFDVNTEGPWPYFHADTTHICRWRQVKFTDDSFDNVISWQWEFPGGTPSSSTEQNPVVQYHHTGTYDVILTISDGIHSQTMHKKSYIHVHTCTGIDDLSSDRNTITLYPNPVKERVWLRTNSDIVGTISVTFYSIDGKSILVKQFPGNGQESDYSIDLSRISPGIYLVQIRGDRWQEYLKLIVQ